jgi:hypothetical protein
MPYQNVIVTPEFLDTLTNLSRTDQRRILRAMLLLDADEQYPSLNVHQLKGKETGQWVAYATKGLRITFIRLDDGRKELKEASHHYGD